MESRRAPIFATLLRGFRKRCPRCGKGRLFRHWYTLHERCNACHLKYETADGSTSAFLVRPSVGLLDADIPDVTTTALSMNRKV